MYNPEAHALEGKNRDFGPYHFLKEKWLEIEGIKEVPQKSAKMGPIFKKKEFESEQCKCGNQKEFESEQCNCGNLEKQKM